MVSWYHGPLVPGKNNTPDNVHLPVRSADQLVRYNSEYGMFDVSYAAAWELGRLLALQNKRFALDLAQWNRDHTQARKAAEWDVAHLPVVSASQRLELPKTVRDWLADLEQLKGVPFNYLVPEETILPQESLRFFKLIHSGRNACSTARIALAAFPLRISQTNACAAMKSWARRGLRTAALWFVQM